MTVEHGGKDVQENQNNQHTLIELPTQDEFQSIVARANGSDQEAIDALRKTLNEHPRIWQQLGDMFEHAKAGLILAIARDDRAMRESLIRHAAQMEQELGRENASLLEKMVVRRLVLNWLQLQHCDAKNPEPLGKSLALKSACERHFRQALLNLELARNKLVQRPVETPVKQKPVKQKPVAGRINGQTQNGRIVKRVKRRKGKSNGVPVNRIGNLIDATRD
ncbi:MAG: hypothetical protein ACC619_04115 [Paracoccaceae bacterium]